MNKKIILTVIIVLLLFAGIIAVTQETPFQADIFSGRAPDEYIATEENEDYYDYFFDYEIIRETPDWIKPLRWFRSNQAGMALEEIPSRFLAIRNEYALAVEFARQEELPEYLFPYYDDDYFIEVRMLYEKGRQIRTQWIFRDINQTARLISVITESLKADDDDDTAGEKPYLIGFIEIFDENAFLISEYRFFNDGSKSRIDSVYKDGLLISSTVLMWEDTPGGGEYREAYADFLRYNRSLYLRSVERVFYRDRRISLSDEPVVFSFPRNMAEVVRNRNPIGEKFNAYPEFFGEVLIQRNERIIFTTDDRSNILNQTLYDEEDNIVWAIHNTWFNDRIISTLKIEDGIEYLAEYEYNSAGDRILERNFRNGVLERLVHTEGNTDIEELYLNDVVVLRAVWEDGRKISETRTGNR